MDVLSLRGSKTSLLAGGSIVTRQSGRGRLLVVSGASRALSVRVGTEPVVVGSGSDVDLVLADRTVSRRHLEVRLSERGVIARDLGSTNGSFVHGSRFSELLLAFGAEIVVGRTTLKYVPEEESVQVAPATSERFGKLHGRDTRVRALFRMLEEVAPTDATILIEGETGTGKELFAEEIHAHSLRRDRPFVVFDCGAVAHELIQSALFGHVRGAFTGAVQDRLGAFAEADGGTLFLDEIGELALDVQPVLLRALDRKMIRPLGKTQYHQVDVRIVAATNRDLRAEVAAGRFREDLFYRLAVVKLQVPPLRDRPDDIPLLVDKFVRESTTGPTTPLASGELDRLAAYDWPGNVRELRNIVERACLLRREALRFDLPPSADRKLTVPTLAASRPAAPGVAPAVRSFRDARTDALAQFERQYLEGLLRAFNDNLSAAARAAQLDRKQLRELLRKHGLRATRGD